MDNSKKSIAVVIPVFRSAHHLNEVTSEIITTIQESNQILKMKYYLSKIVLVDDGSTDGSSEVIQMLQKNPLISGVFLNRNYGQHAAIFAGVLTTQEDVIITMDEDGEHDPKMIEKMIEKMENSNADVVYAKFQYKTFNMKELLSSASKRVIAFLASEPNIRFISSFRVIKGSIFRSAAVYANNGSFLDISLSWITQKVEVVDGFKRDSNRSSTYDFRKLMSHFGNLLFASGIKPLRYLYNLGLIISLGSLLATIYILFRKYFNLIPIQGWVSSIVVLIFFGGLLMSSIGLVARYVSVVVETASGKPFFTIKNQK